MVSRKENLPRRGDQPLPVPVAGTLPILPETLQLDAVIAPYAAVINDERERYTRANVALVTAAIPHLDGWRRQLAHFNRPATKDEIFTQVAHTIPFFPDRKNDKLFCKQLPDHIAALQPTKYAVASGCWRVRDRERWLTWPTLKYAIEYSEYVVSSYARALKANPNQYLLAANREHRAERRAARRAAQQEEKRRRAIAAQVGQPYEEWRREQDKIEGAIFWGDIEVDRPGNDENRARMVSYWARIFGEGHDE
jgi:hypothetical protein